MSSTISLDSILVPSEDVVARMISDELIIVPLSSGIGDMEDELFSLNGSGQAIWERLDGSKSLRAVAESLAAEYSAPADEIRTDVLGLVEELYKRGIVVEPSGA